MVEFRRQIIFPFTSVQKNWVVLLFVHQEMMGETEYKSIGYLGW
jgi:hypothetical protein